MDTSEIYINMCDCPEIQKQWKLQNGDFFYDIRISIGNGVCPYMIGYEGKHFDEFGEYADVEFCTWLPRQDQIQEMIDDDPMYKKGQGWCTMPRKFTKRLAEFVDSNDYNMVATSMEQLWLAFYMEEKYSLVWDGEEWKKK